MKKRRVKKSVKAFSGVLILVILINIGLYFYLNDSSKFDEKAGIHKRRLANFGT